MKRAGNDLPDHELLPHWQVASVPWLQKAVAWIPPPPFAELSREGICPVTSGAELKAAGIMNPATLAHLSLFRDESASHCDGQQDTVHC